MIDRALSFLHENKKYVFYASSIVISRGLEYLVLFFAAFYLTKDLYGELEFYKKIIELFAVALAFGLPSLLLTYTKSDNSKVYLNVLALLCIVILSIVLLPVLMALNYQSLLIPIVFHAIFFNNGIMPILFITKYGSIKASMYKTIISLLFYSGVFTLIIYHPEPQKAFVFINYYLIIIGALYIIFLYRAYNLQMRLLKKYYRLFKKLLFSSLTLVVSNFANIMFLYTDIMMLKLISNQPNLDIANYSFSLNIANLLIIIPFTIVQVDIEKIKTLKHRKSIANKILKFVIIGATFSLLGYFILINTFYINYKETAFIFLVILFAKVFQTQSVLYGTILLVKKRFNFNLLVNLSVLILNILLSYLFYTSIGVIGVAVASFLTLATRFVILKYASK